MEGLVRLFSSSVLPDGTLKKAMLPDGKAIAVCRIGNDIYAFDDMCSHGASSLSEEGELEGFNIVCGWHAGAFDVRTGAAVASPCTRAIRVYRVREVEGDICLCVSQGGSQS